MTTKTITVTEEAYNSLKRLKSRDESFSQALLRLGKGKGVAAKYFGILKKDDAKDLQKRLKAIRKEISEDFDKRKDVLFR